jgi:hypothetical protein
MDGLQVESEDALSPDGAPALDLNASRPPGCAPVR